jgi:hypothetical protein
MTVYELAARLGLTEEELFVRAHKAYGGLDRSKLERDIRTYLAGGAIAEYVTAFIRSYRDQHHEQLPLHLVPDGTRAWGCSPRPR